MKKILFLLLFLPIISFSQNCVKVDSVYSTAKLKQLSARDIRFGVKQIAEEVLSEKYCLSDSGDRIQVEISYVGMPSKSLRFGGVGAETQTTEIRVKLHKDIEEFVGFGSSSTDVRTIMIELADGKIPFSKMTVSNAIKQAIEDAVNKM